MFNYKALAAGLCGVSFFAVLLCLFLSAAGLRSETSIVFGMLLPVLVIGFFCAYLYKQEERQLNEAVSAPIQTRALMNEAISALRVMEQEPTPEHQADFQQKAAVALMALGDVQVTSRQEAIAAAAAAIDAQHALRQACENEAPETQIELLRQTAAIQSENAVRAIRKMLH